MIKTPIYDALVKYRNENTIVMHVPGHKRGKLFEKAGFILDKDLMSLDTTEVDGIDNLHHPRSSIEEGQKMAAKAFGARETFFLVNGSTCGIEAMLMSVGNPGDKIIISRNCHQSAINGAVLAGLNTVFVMPDYDDEGGLIGEVRAESVERALCENPDAIAVFITSPTYQGVCSDLGKISEIVHRHKALLLVDEAHGGHFIFHPSLPMPALMAGADMAVQSTHKTMCSMTGSSMLHVGSERVNLPRLRQVLSMLQTSSPSHLMLASLDISRAIMEERGRELLSDLIDYCTEFRKEINKIKGLFCFDGENIDNTRITINVRELGITGFMCDKKLRMEYHIQVEMADMYNITAVPSIADDEKDLISLLSAMRDLAAKCSKEVLKNRWINYCAAVPIMSLRDAFYSVNRPLNFEDAMGKISGGIVVPYPPGIPLLLPGELITEEETDIIRYCIQNNITIYGVDSEENKLMVIE